MRIRSLIKALGGPTVVAEALGQRIATVGNWSLRDAIAPEHHIAVWRLALAKGIQWTPPGAEGWVPPSVAPSDEVSIPPKPRSRRAASEAA